MPRSASGNARTNYWVPMLASAIRVLETFYEAEGQLSLHQVSRAAKVGKTSAFRILFTLDKLGYVEKNPSTGRYLLGLRIIGAARHALSGGGLAKIARPYLQELRDQFDETANLAVLRKQELVYLEIFESPHSFRMASTVGSRVPWHSTALGKSIAAFLPEAGLQALLEQYDMTRFTSHTITNARRFTKTLAAVREQGYSVDNEETELGASCVAVPILNDANLALAGISISGPSPRIREKQKRIIQALKTVSTSISNSLNAG